MKIIAQCPTRLSLFGGGTDVNPYAEKYGGICINLAINLRQHILLDTESKIHDWIREDSLDFINTLLAPLKVGDCGINHTFDGIIESGLGSSASLAVALIGAINKYKGIKMTKSEIAEKAWDIEVNKLGLYGGKQDQYAAVYGGANFLVFEDKVYRYSFPRIGIEKIYPYLMLFYTGQNRKSPKIQEAFKTLTESQKDALDQLKEIAYAAVDPIKSGDVEQVAKLLQATWEFKKKSNKGVTNERIDLIYQSALEAGAWAGKILGAGGGGHMIFICPPEKQNELKRKLGNIECKWIDFGIDWNGLEVREID